jgi:hypothetical protein
MPATDGTNQAPRIADESMRPDKAASRSKSLPNIQLAKPVIVPLQRPRAAPIRITRKKGVGLRNFSFDKILSIVKARIAHAAIAIMFAANN